VVQSQKIVLFTDTTVNTSNPKSNKWFEYKKRGKVIPVARRGGP
jgi:hypothetical protein